MEELWITELTTDQIEALCSSAEEAARKHVLTKVPSSMLERLNISVEANGAKPVNLTVEIDTALSLQMKGHDSNKLVNEAAKEALKASDNYLRKLI